ncbi:uncharacterized protein BT62DRAFT_931306 [Guyanagaster necrorhizus]|uniref:Uncharacterized protein n=1 Tax=Guyanagaster necrorhizus TaxID=856835 RepID=A0A9P8AUB5_9AGAR|nr:uncharacterized protein BT62DRAFT_931306 [Guyanagaster necrorhizus MCA 3950]KAG7446737.1 hypothetical protein BT62DRAFT_931306 [Guyanagaster necrorhizus MCA 3950]
MPSSSADVCLYFVAIIVPPVPVLISMLHPAIVNIIDRARARARAQNEAALPISGSTLHCVC